MTFPLKHKPGDRHPYVCINTVLKYWLSDPTLKFPVMAGAYTKESSKSLLKTGFYFYRPSFLFIHSHETYLICIVILPEKTRQQKQNEKKNNKKQNWQLDGLWHWQLHDQFYCLEVGQMPQSPQRNKKQETCSHCFTRTLQISLFTQLYLYLYKRYPLVSGFQPHEDWVKVDSNLCLLEKKVKKKPFFVFSATSFISPLPLAPCDTNTSHSL